MSDGETRREFLEAFGVASISILGGCQTSGDSDTQTPTPTKTPTSAPTDTPTSTPTETATPEPDDVFENMTAYEQAVKDVRDRIDVNENVRRDVQNMFSDGNEIEALEETMQHGATQAGFSSPAYYDSEKEYKTSGAIQAVARAVELYGEEDPDNTQEALGLHRINVDVKRVLLDGQEADVAIVEDTKADETVLATNINLAPGTEGPNADAYRVGTEAQGTTQELLKGLIDADDMGNANNFDWETWRNAVERTNNYDPEANARTMSRYFGDIVAGASLSHDDVIGGSVDPQHPMLLTEQFQQQLSEGPTTGLIEGTRKATQKVAETDRDESEIYVLGKDYNIIACEYDFSQGIPETLEDISS
ncbi:hypothetical protein [Haloquadratum walsbyi]|uniref:Uncharacterized protein n=1 Tax=Haloquadratum walsbyi (strain DSM 16790 / HBSQ001) TaxID=362976 RepID=Q18F78_HALWD|nr:hypothetical protein [Haloquadratum walsbyi]CAJ53380.1 uncharacterized protein HQ_3283A [Haloquadratum walsbyi DSM 16790]